ncbi:MAG: copper chaperone PCu(A)C [Acidobacteriota bacterium]|nr:copper chaperone PCu(A)C [Acidobacteriota bacterium]
MTILRTALVALLLNVTVLAQPAPTATDATIVRSGTTASVYLTFNNPSMYDIYVMSATSDEAGKVELYSCDKPVDSMTVAAYGSLELKAGGMFLRLSELKSEWKAGESITVTMLTDGGATIVATAVVKR